MKTPGSSLTEPQLNNKPPWNWNPHCKTISIILNSFVLELNIPITAKHHVLETVRCRYVSKTTNEIFEWILNVQCDRMLTAAQSDWDYPQKQLATNTCLMRHCPAVPWRAALTREGDRLLSTISVLVILRTGDTHLTLVSHE
ncbi:hypothetical protein J6590_010249 [Homalodisca vitripennis]|nr:hypothetical protein J6590_010249 [Homalodisca vitripennis]